VNEAAEMGRLSAKDKVRLARLKLIGAARVFYSSQPQLRADDVSYEVFRTPFINRFQDKHTDQYYDARVQNASQENNESPEVFLDRLWKLCQRTVCSSVNPVEQTVINQEADRRILAAFINGLIGAVGKQVRMQMPDNIDKATTPEREEKGSICEDGGSNARVFTVGGSRGVHQEIIMEDPGESFNGAIELPAHSVGLDRHGTRVVWIGVFHAGLTAGLLCNLRVKCRPWERALRRGQGAMTIVMRRDQWAFSVINEGCWDIYNVIVLEGKEEI